jgi:hypothetical protein
MFDQPIDQTRQLAACRRFQLHGNVTPAAGASLEQSFEDLAQAG